MRLALTALLAALAAIPAHAKPASITPAQMTSWPIVCDAHATPAEHYAASEFQTLFHGLTGKTLPILQQAARRGHAIFIGPGAVAASKRAMPHVTLGEEGLRIRLDRDALCIDGGRPRGTLYGVYEFFEELCGVRYLTFDDTYYPPNGRSLKLPQGVRSCVPQFKFRWSYYGETSRYPAFAARLRVNTVSDDPKLGGKTGYRLVNHCVAYLVPPAKYGKTHPEYYALVDGKRKWQTTDGGGPQLCLTNPHVRDIVVRAIEDEIKTNPAQRNFNIAQMDNGDYCTCPKCAALDRREGSHSGTMIAFVNSVAERVEKKYPNALISTFAYAYTRKPPKTLRPRRNVMIQLCSIECCDLHAIDDPHCPLNRSFCHDMQVWNSKCDKLFIWHYNTNFSSYMLPFPNLRSIGKSVAYFAKHQARGVFMQAAGNGFSTELSDLRNYVMARCLWKPGRNSWKESLEFCRLHYRESAGPIIAYLTYYHHLVAAAGVHPNCFPTESALCITPQSARRIFAYFQQAMSLAKSDVVRDRVEKASLCAYRAALSGSSMHLTFEDGVCRPDLAGLDANLLARYEQLCAKYGVTMESEQVPVGTYIDAMRRLYAGLKAVRLENETWRVVLLPGSNGKVVEMTYKPTGRNIVEPARAFNRFRYEEWVREGPGPASANILAYDVVQSTPDSVTLALTAQDGSRFERSIRLDGDAVRFRTTITAGPARSLDLWVHPEYDTATNSADSRVLGIYVKAPRWVYANRGWNAAQPTPDQSARVTDAAAGGAFAYYNTRAKFGVEERFDPGEIGRLGLFWEPSRRQVNLELIPKVTSLAQGASTSYGYEVRYLRQPPAAP